MTATLNDVTLGPQLTPAQAEAIFRQGKEAVVFALLEMAKMLAERQSPTLASPAPTTPSGMVPPYLKPSRRQRRKKPGRKDGHLGARRPPPDRIDHRQEHRAATCLACGGELQRCHDTRTRYVEDMPLPDVIQPQPRILILLGRDWLHHENSHGNTCRKQ